MFHKNKQSRDGVMHYCKECQSRKDRKIPYQEIVALTKTNPQSFSQDDLNKISQNGQFFLN
jgi:hypothetical protein